MPSQEAIAQTVNRYLEFLSKGSADDIASLYAADATIEDPIGSDIRRGHDAVREFYAAVEGIKKETELVHLRIGGSEAAFFWHLTLDAGAVAAACRPSR